MAYATAGTPTDLNKQVNQLAQMARQSGDHMGFFQKYLTSSNPNRLAAQLAQGMVQQQVQDAETQKNLNQPQPPTVLDGLEQQQGMAAMPTARGMFNPDVYAQGGIGAGLGEEPQGQAQMARGGVVAFAGKGPSKVSAPDLTVDEFIDEIQRGRVIEGIEKSRDAARAAVTGEGAVPPETITAENDIALKRAIEQNKARAAAARGASPAASVEGMALETPAQAEARAAGINAGRPAPTVAAKGIAAGRGVPPSVQAVAPQVAPPPAAAAGAEEVAAGAEKSLASRAVAEGGKKLGTLARSAKFGLGAPAAAYGAFEAGQYVGDKLNEYTPIQEGIRGLIDRFGATTNTEDQANAAMQPGFIDNQMAQRKVTKAAGVDPVVGSIADNVSKQESGGTFFDPASLGRVNPQQTSYGSFQLDVSGGLPGFVKEHGSQFGLTAKMGTPEFTKQWQEAAKKNPTEFGAAQLKAFDKGYLTPTRNALATILPEVADPRVLSYFASRGVQGGLSKDDKEAVSNIYNDADGDVKKFLIGMGEYDKQNYANRFKTENSKKDNDPNKYTYDRHAKRVQANLDASLGTTAGERFRGDVAEAVDVVRQQPPVKAVEDIAKKGVEKAREATTNQIEKVFPITTGLEQPKPAASKTVQEQYADMLKNQAAQQAPAEAAPKDNKLFGYDRDRLGNIFLHSGAATLANPSQYALTSVGKGLQAGLTADEAREGKIAERAAKAEEGAKNRAEKQYEAGMAYQKAELSKKLPQLDQIEGANQLFAQVATLSGMSPQQRRYQGTDDATFKQLQRQAAAIMKQIQGGAPAAGGKGQEPNPGWGQAVQGKG